MEGSARRHVQSDLVGQLSMAETRITRQRQHIENQERLATSSRSLLASFERCLVLHHHHRGMVLRTVDLKNPGEAHAVADRSSTEVSQTCERVPAVSVGGE
jgi:hypothetical protein